MTPRREVLEMYGAPSAEPPLEWAWAETQLVAAPTYWTSVPGTRLPHPRPVWGVWHDAALFLSIGSPAIKRLAIAGAAVTINLASDVDVVIVEGTVAGDSTDPVVVTRYDAKYDWAYDVVEHGALTEVRPERVLAWRSAGFAGRDGFQQTGRWQF